MRVAGLLLCVVMLYGCGKSVRPFDVGGSKADGTVIMGASIGGFDKIDWSGADDIALTRCKAWGYSEVEAFTGTQTQCTYMGAYGCVQSDVTRSFQCID